MEKQSGYYSLVITCAAIKLQGSHISCKITKTLSECLWTGRRGREKEECPSNPFPCCPVNRQCPSKKT